MGADWLSAIAALAAALIPLVLAWLVLVRPPKDERKRPGDDKQK